MPDRPNPLFTRILAVITSESDDLQAGLDESTSKHWDRYWSYYIVQRFTWQRFINWWASRRWVEPRDIRKR